MPHYYDSQPETPHEIRQLDLNVFSKHLVFNSDSGVFSKEHIDPGSELLIEAAAADLEGFAENARLLDLGCGYGPVGISLAVKFPSAEIVMSDVNERALDLTRQNIRLNRITNASAIVSDGMKAHTGTFSAIISNPPIRTGKATLYPMWEDCRNALIDNGRLYLVIRKKQGSDSAKKYLSELFGSCETIDRGAGYHVLLATKLPAAD